MKKKIVLLVLVVIVAAGGFAAYKTGIYRQFIGKGQGEEVASGDIYVSSLGDVMGLNNSYNPNVYMGVVEGQESTGVNKSSERDIDKVLVAVGDTVEVGTPLFTYKTEQLEADIVQYNYDIEGANLQIDDYNRQILKLQEDMKRELDKDKKKDKEMKEDLAAQIQGIENSIKMSNNTIEQTQAKIAEAQNKINNSTVVSNSAGVITNIADENNPNNTDGNYITILASKDKRVKGQINEQNVWSINVGANVTLRSRVDDTKTWKGTITKIDTESKSEATTNMGGSDDSSDKSTKYPFYVELTDSEGLMMGQHLYVEIDDEAQAETLDLTKGTYIYDYYVVTDDDGTSYVWVADSKNKLKKQPVELGEHNESQMVYEVKSGVGYKDMLAYPMEDYEEGMSVVSEMGEAE